MLLDAERKFDLNVKRMDELNKLIFEYENLSMETYNQTEVLKDVITHRETERTVYQPKEQQLLFNDPSNEHIKKEF